MRKLSFFTFTLLLLIAASSAALFAEVPGCTNITAYPWERVLPYACFSVLHSDGSKTPYPAGVGVVWTSRAVRYSGWHGHDSGNRPVAQYDAPDALGTGNSVSSTTNSTGCVEAHVATLPGISGDYVFEATAETGTTACVDIYAKTYTTFFYPNGVHSQRSLVQIANNGNFQPFVIHADADHALDQRAVTQGTTESRVYSIAAGYISLQQAGGMNPFLLDKVDLIRGSLPDGGIADNAWLIDYPQYEWRAPYAEFHDKGLDIDISNPIFYTTNGVEGLAQARFWQFLVPAVVVSQCRFGNLTPAGIIIPTDTPHGVIDYWATKAAIHLNCGARNTVPTDPRQVIN